MERTIKYFQDTKADNTIETFRLAKERLTALGIKKIVLASTTGRVARQAMDFFKDTDVQLIVIPHQYDFNKKDKPLPKELVQELRDNGHEVHVGTMLFHTDKLYGSEVPNIIANFLRCFCEGVKVCYEMVLMSTDAGLLENGESVIAIAGTVKNSDTALVMQAGSTRSLGRLKVNEIICKPLNYREISE